LELSWSTFLLEIFNFLILVWILKRFLYQPILDVIARRRKTIEEQINKAGQLKADADALKERYEHRLYDWEKERQKALDKLMRELEDNRVNQLENLRTELAQEEEKIHVARVRQDKQAMREIEQRALQQSAEFASRLLSEAAGPELENRLFELLLEGLTTLPDEKIDVISSKWGQPPGSIQVTSAYPLADDKRQQLEDALRTVTDLSVPVYYELDSGLRAGLSITIGAWILQLNVRDELQGFMEFSHSER